MRHGYPLRPGRGRDGGGFPAPYGGYGIRLVHGFDFKVSLNQVSHWEIGIEVDGLCSADFSLPSNRNLISKNQVREVDTGILVYAAALNGGEKSVPRPLPGQTHQNSKRH